jgi:hypothetical protein
MRELKFRAWDGQRVYFPSDEDTYIKLSKGEIRSPGVILMQFTGLYDRNGTEIYEGDILLHESGCCWPEAVEWQHNGWSDNTDKPHHKVVIGNIHENGELLR